MCGRFVTPSQAEMERFWELSHQSNNPFAERRYNAAPTQTLPIIRFVDGKLEISPARWGLVPVWAKTPKSSYSTINARVETVATKPTYKSAFKSRRCLVPAVGYYEWKPMPDGKQPYYFKHQADELLAFAGLWETWAPTSPDSITSFTIVVGEPNALAAEFHDRMPAILARHDWDKWLDGSAGIELLKPAPVEMLSIYPVSRRVNNVQNQGPTLIEPLTEVS